MPAYRLSHLVPYTLASVQAQTFRNWECIVVDDGSPENLALAIEPFLADSRIKLLETDNGGVSVARNRAIALSQAPTIALLDGDDMMRPDYLAEMVPALDADAEAVLVSCNARLFGALPAARELIEAGRQASTARLPEVLSREHLIYGGCVFRRETWASAGGFDPALRYSEDFDMWVRFLLADRHARYLDRVLCEYRIRSNSSSRTRTGVLQADAAIYRKVLASPDATTEARAIAQTMLARVESDHARETAIESVASGNTQALKRLRNSTTADGSFIWQAANALWTVAPGLAPVMLRWREQANERHAFGNTVEPLSETADRREDVRG